jgi:hypothetical protein
MVLASIFWIPAGFVSIRNYYRIGSLDYLIFAGWFFTNGFGFLTSPIQMWLLAEYGVIDPVFNLIFETNQSLIFFFTASHALRLKWQWKDKPIILWIILVAFTLFLPLDALLEGFMIDILPGDVDLLGMFLFDLYYSIIWLFAYFSVKPGFNDTRIRIVIAIWRFVGLTDLLISCMMLTAIALAVLGISPLLIYQGFEIIVYLAIPYATSIFLVGVLFPEAMLISEAQILRARKLYDTLERSQPEVIEKTRLLDYMQKASQEYILEAKAIVQEVQNG